jgi:hypothetical protein
MENGPETWGEERGSRKQIKPNSKKRYQDRKPSNARCNPNPRLIFCLFLSPRPIRSLAVLVSPQLQGVLHGS